MTTKILLEEMEFYAYIGCSDEEKRIGTRFLVDLTLYGDFTKAAQTDNLSDAVNYVEVRSIVARVMQQPANLLESVAYRICTTLRQQFSNITQIEVTLRKLNPVIGVKARAAAVTISL